jgi:hypothetical protein
MMGKMTAKGRKARSKLKLDKAKMADQKQKWNGECYGYGLEGKAKQAKKVAKKGLKQRIRTLIQIVISNRLYMWTKTIFMV